MKLIEIQDKPAGLAGVPHGAGSLARGDVVARKPGPMTPETKAAIRGCAKAVCVGCPDAVIIIGGPDFPWAAHLVGNTPRDCHAVAIRARFPEAFEEAE